MASKKKVATTVVAVATAAALLLGGTFAWQSISQRALNEASDVINPGGRLHDDFDGTNKDVYVENFATEDIYARVRFDEYMEIVMNYDSAAQKTEIVTAPATKTDLDTYRTHLFGDEQSNPTDDYWNWTMGGEDSDAGDVYYMPTFNVNKDSLAADVNGVFNGANFEIKDKKDVEYIGYTEYTADSTKEGYEIYDGDTNNVDELSQKYTALNDLTTAVNDIIDNGTNSKHYIADNLVLTEKKVSHTAAQVNPNTNFISMEEWMALPEAEQEGPFWVYDVDGWCYWAQAIPGRNEDGSTNTTGLLMDGIALNGAMDDTWYYAINVVGQFITADDAGKGDNTGFYDKTAGESPTENAEKLLEKIGVDVDGDGADEEPAADGWYNEVEKMTAGTTETVEIDGIKWFVLIKNDGKALLQAAEPVGKIPVQIAFEYGEMVDYPDHDIDVWVNSAVEDSYAVYNGQGTVDHYIDGFLVGKPDLVKYSVDSTIYTIDLFNTMDKTNNESVMYEELTRKVFIPSVADFASINYTTAVPGDATKDRTYGSSGLITKEMADIMLASTSGGLIPTRTSPANYDGKYYSSTWALMTVTSNEGTLATGEVGATTSVDVFPMLWVDYATAVKDNPASGGGTTGGEEEEVETIKLINGQSPENSTLITKAGTYTFRLEAVELEDTEGTTADLSSLSVGATAITRDLTPSLDTLTEGKDYTYNAEAQELTLTITGDYDIYMVTDKTGKYLHQFAFIRGNLNPFELNITSYTLENPKVGYYTLGGFTWNGSAAEDVSISYVSDADAEFIVALTNKISVKADHLLAFEENAIGKSVTVTGTATVNGEDKDVEFTLNIGESTDTPTEYKQIDLVASAEYEDGITAAPNISVGDSLLFTSSVSGADLSSVTVSGSTDGKTFTPLTKDTDYTYDGTNHVLVFKESAASNSIIKITDKTGTAAVYVKLVNNTGGEEVEEPAVFIVKNTNTGEEIEVTKNAENSYSANAPQNMYYTITSGISGGTWAVVPEGEQRITFTETSEGYTFYADYMAEEIYPGKVSYTVNDTVYTLTVTVVK